MEEHVKSALSLVAAAAVALSGLAAENRVIEEQLEPAEGWVPVGFAFLPVHGLQFPGPTYDVDGFQLSLIAGHAHEFSGLGLAVFGSWADGDMDGLVLSGLCNWGNGASFGVHLASVANYAEGDVNGLQLSLFNSAYAVSGVQLGVVNCVSEGAGLQCGLWNLAESARGLQIGLVNMAMEFSGVQVGLGNIIGSSPLTACVLVNAWF